jgi:hypothetical protein
MQPSPSKRNYIRRKKCLNDSFSLVRTTLNFINTTLGVDESSDGLDRRARDHASAIEAVCWDPRTSKLTDDIYQKLMVSKTRELCLALISQNLSPGSAVQILQELRKMDAHFLQYGRPLRRVTPLPLPVLADRDGDLVEGRDFGGPGIEAFPEFPRLRIDPPDTFYDGDAMHRWAAE